MSGPWTSPRPPSTPTIRPVQCPCEKRWADPEQDLPKSAGRRRVIAPEKSNGRGRSGGSRSSGASRLVNKRRDPALELNPTTDIPEIEAFTEWALCDEVQTAIAGMGITKPTPIQCLTTGPVLARKDVIAKAETGTGKTLAFGAGMVSMIDPTRSTVLGLVLAPTRELALQVHDVLCELGNSRGIKTCLIVGGDPPQPQVKALQDGAQLVIGTPGRVMDLYNQGFLSFPWTEFVVLDEADEMLEIGFIDDIRKILSYTPEERTTLLFSATFPPALLKLARDYTRDPLEVATAKGVATVDHITQSWLKVNDDDKWLALTRLIEASDPDDTFLVFGDRRTDVDQLIRRLERMPFPCKALHGGYDQASRTRVMTAFRAKEVKCLVATDVASRGLDVKHVSHVVNFGVPRDVSTYTHRIGRTGRAGAKGTAVTMVTRRDHGRWTDLTGQMNWEVELQDLPERTPRRGQGGRGRSASRDQGASRDRSEPRRPRRDAQETASPERGEPVRKSSRRRSEDGGERQERSARPKRQERGEPVRKSTRRPREESAGRQERPKRQERGEPVRKSTRRPNEESAGRQEPPKREERSKPKQADSGGFGGGITSAPEASKPRAAKPKASAPKPQEPSAPKPAAPATKSDGGGFGAGV
ncbi:MAG: DEAD/DEAH box helicase [Planctomycetota bacterium]|nr:DEAD/DEAH box helicase [Planctomycetota bacterium]